MVLHLVNTSYKTDKGQNAFPQGPQVGECSCTTSPLLGILKPEAMQNLSYLMFQFKLKTDQIHGHFE